MSKKLKEQLIKIVNKSKYLNEEVMSEDVELDFIDKHLDSKIEIISKDISNDIFNRED
jgi:hypothetical protein